jgi:AhpD family alkylhydroperoxidase
MSKDFPAIIAEIGQGARELRRDIPEVFAAYSDFAKAAMKDGALSEKQKELIALAIGVAVHCDGCIAYHTRSLVRLGASRAEVGEALGVAIQMGGGPSVNYAADAMRAFLQFSEKAAG